MIHTLMALDKVKPACTLTSFRTHPRWGLQIGLTCALHMHSASMCVCVCVCLCVCMC